MTADQQIQPPSGNPEFNAGINMLPGFQGDTGYNPEDMQPLTQSNVDFAPGQQGPGVVTNTIAPPALPFGGPEPGAPRATPNYSIPGGYPTLGGTSSDWRGNASNENLSSFRDNATTQQPGFFQRLLDSIKDGIGGVGDMFEHLQPPRPASVGGTPSRAAFGQTSFQSQFPGSLIGPTSGLVTNPYSGAMSHAMTHTTSPTGYATAFSNVVKARNIA